jgi:hypothetical protein
MIIITEPTESSPCGITVGFRHRRLSFRGSTTRVFALGMLSGNNNVTLLSLPVG